MPGMQLSESLGAGDQRASVHYATLTLAGNDADRRGRPLRTHAGVGGRSCRESRVR